MTQYEVRLRCERALAARLQEWMRTHHIPAVLATGCFVSADFGTMGGEFRTVYSARTTADLERYLAQYAERLRADFAAVFPTGVVASREVWETIERFDHGP